MGGGFAWGGGLRRTRGYRVTRICEGGGGDLAAASPGARRGARLEKHLDEEDVHLGVGGDDVAGPRLLPVDECLAKPAPHGLPRLRGDGGDDVEEGGVQDGEAEELERDAGRLLLRRERGVLAAEDRPDELADHLRLLRRSLAGEDLGRRGPSLRVRAAMGEK